MEEIIGYNFKDKSLLDIALTHSSYVHEHKQDTLKSNERLEFLGDAVLEIVVSEYLFNNYSNLAEGDMTKTRAGVVCESALADIAIKNGFGEYIKLGHGEDMTGGRQRPSVLSDFFEAIIGAVYIDGGFEKVKGIVLKFIEPVIIRYIEDRDGQIDYKTELQEVLQSKSKAKINYILTSETGPAHNKKFFVDLKWGNKVIGKGVGKTKKEADKKAAKQALINMKGGSK